MAKFVEAPFSTEPPAEFSVVTFVSNFGTAEYVIMAIVAAALIPIFITLFRGLFARSGTAEHD